MRVVLLRPPRYVWPFNSETSAFWQPLGLLCLAAAARRELPELDIEVWDAPGEKFGWATLRRKLTAGPIDVLGIGDETVSAHEALRAAALAKQLHPNCLVIAGGTYFAYAIEQALDSGCVDVIVRGEGERTFVELLRHVDDRGEWRQIRGLVFRDDRGELCVTPHRPLIDNLDELPPPAYDLIPMDKYGRGSRNHPALVSIEHSRGCIDNCSFCILWKHMGEPLDGNGQMRPRLRTKSAPRSFEEVMHLHKRYGRRTFGWVDPTFNASPQWSDAWAERMLGSSLMDARGKPRTLHTAWLRADCVIRDEKLGILEKLVRAGMHQVMIGAERDDDVLASLGKHNNDPQICREAFAIFRERYPQVYTIGTILFGLPGDTRADLKRLASCQYRMGMDYCFMMPLTPNPGTGVAEEAIASGRVANTDLPSYNFHTPICRTETLSLRQLESIYWRIMLSPHPKRIVRTIQQLLTQRDPRKRRVHLALLGRGANIAARALLRAVFRPQDDKPTLYSRRPSWYDQ